ncbi:hypothetical protein C623_0203265 [Bacillus thuringiensis serovar aizawai str. Hu4-2]|nr:hypothetical protein C623_0203265 [Bacillus thuringiensis serovar aizawai str. Hu4-2]
MVKEHQEDISNDNLFANDLEETLYELLGFE